MICAISGEVPEEPVVSKKSGILFEKRLIERYVEDYGKCPVTEEPLVMDDLVSVKTDKMVKPRALQGGSVPGLRSMELDQMMLSHFALEQRLHTSRQELSQALYQKDAACRVIARLKKERDEARRVLTQTERHVPTVTSSVACRVIARLKKERDEARRLLTQIERHVPTVTSSALGNGKRVAEDEDLVPRAKRVRLGLSATINAELTACNTMLSQQRKRSQISATLAPVDALERYTQISRHPLHKSSKPGILSTDIHPSKDIIATGGVDANAVVFDRTSGQILSTLSGHTKKVTSVKFVGQNDLFVTGSADKTVRIWQASEEGNYNCRHVLKNHTAEVQAVTIHATNNYCVTAALDHTWCFYDLSTGLCLTQVALLTDSYTSAAFHPDGLILGTGSSEAFVRIWDVRSLSTVAKFDSHTGAVTAISFSENGYFLATAAHDGVKLWDLRKLRNFQTFTPYDLDTPTNSVEFDHSGRYLAIAGSDTRIYQVANVKSEWNCIKTFPDLSGTGKATSVKFGPDAKYITVGSMDENLRIFGLPGDDAQEEIVRKLSLLMK